jgi:hypothetical protein
MMKKIVGIIVILLMIGSISSLNVIAGDEENPEIEDATGDTNLSFLDIEKAWFYEDQENPEYLFISLKLRDIKETFPGTFAVKWSYNDVIYVAGLTTYFFKPKDIRSGLYQRGTYWQWKSMPICEGIFDYNKNTFTWTIPKSNIGNPQQGERLTQTKCSAVPNFPISITDLFMDFRDFAPNNYTDEHGKDYILQY